MDKLVTYSASYHVLQSSFLLIAVLTVRAREVPKCNLDNRSRVVIEIDEDMPSCLAEVGEIYQGYINKTSLKEIKMHSLSHSTAYRVTTESQSANKETPLLVVVERPADIISWTVPMNGAGYGRRVSRTLCTHTHMQTHLNHTFNITESNNNEEITISLSTFSKKEIPFKIKIDVVNDFELEINKSISNITITPSGPKFYKFEFKDGVETALLRVESTDETCMTLSIQDAKCPVFDLSDNMERKEVERRTLEGSFHTIGKNGSLRLDKKLFDGSIYIVMGVIPDNAACKRTPLNKELENSEFSKTITMRIEKSLSFRDTLIIVLCTCFLCIGISILTVIFFASFFSYEMRKEKTTGNKTLPKTQQAWEIASKTDSTKDESMINKKIISSTSIKYQKRSISTMAIFYGLPVLQLVVGLRRLVLVTGNEDICFYNLLCSYPLSWSSTTIIISTNAVFSNVGFISMGLACLVCTAIHFYIQEEKETRNNVKYGIEQHSGVFYAISLAIIMEGVMSGLYHVCPSSITFQFDTIYMYTICMLIMVQIYNLMRPERGVHIYSVYHGIAIIILVALVAQYLSVWDKEVIEDNGIDEGFGVRIFCTIAHITFCLLLSFISYQNWSIEINQEVFKELGRTLYSLFGKPIRQKKPRQQSTIHMVLIIIWNLINIPMAIFYATDKVMYPMTTILVACLLNGIFFILSYMGLKLRSGERIAIKTSIFMALAMAAWVTALFFFFTSVYDTQLSPAKSREMNKACVLWEFYDYHDIWHFGSALALFFTFIGVLTLDDDLKNKPRDEIDKSNFRIPN